MKKELLKLQILITFFGLIIIILFLLYYQSQNVFAFVNAEDVLNINFESGFYDQTLNVNISKHLELPSEAEIYYTLNGNNPTNMSTKYETGITLELLDVTKVYPLKVVVYYKGQYSNVFEKTYILDKNIDQRYDINVVNITSDSKNLYDYDIGILVPGKTYDINKENGAVGYIKGNFSNRTDDWLRESHIVMFNSKGDILLDENINLGVSGGTSAAMSVKSFKVESLLKNFELTLFSPGEFTDNSQVSSYNSFRLRSGGQDASNSYIRSSLMSRLANESGFDGCTTTTRTIVYLNGDFYGIFDLQQNYSSSFLARKYGIEDSTQIEKYKSSELSAFKEAQIRNYFHNDLRQQGNRDLLEQYVDMDNYLLYYAINILANNTDWPQNNFQIWRYNGAYNENNKYTDGRYRFLIYDTDLIYYSSKSPRFFEGCDADIFILFMKNLYKATDSSFLNVMQSEYYRNKFINIVLDLLNTSFNENNILKIIFEEFDKVEKEIKQDYDNEFYDEILANIELLKEEVIKRDEALIKAMEKHFHLNKKYTFNIKNTEGITLKWNNTTIYQNEEYSNEYYYNTYIKIKVETYPGYDFQYFVINGKKYYEDEILIEDSLVKNKKINIEVVSKRTNQKLIIDEISAKRDSDWIKITNIGIEKVNLSNYYISDNISNLKKYNLPNIYLNPNQSIIINGKDNYYSLGDYICNFNLSENEFLYLTDGINFADSLYIPRMSSYETYGRYDKSNNYKFFYNYNNKRKAIN